MVVKFQVFKKSSPNSKVTIYLTKREYVDHSSHVDKVEGVVLFDPNFVQDRNVYVQMGLIFRFGREDEESMGYNFVKTLYLDTTQLYPPLKEVKTSEIQRNLINRLGNFAFAFNLEFPKLASPSYTMMRGYEDEGPLINMEYEVMGFVGVNEQDMDKWSVANLTVRRLMECPARFFDRPAPDGSITKTFLTCSGTVTIQASLNSSVYFPDEEINVKVCLKNHASREVKRLKVKVVQLSEVPMFSTNQVRDKTLMKADDLIGLAPGACTNREFVMVARVPARTATGKIFLQGKLRKDAEDQLAPSTVTHPTVSKDDIFGIYVQYAVRVKAALGPLFGDAVLDIPFTLAARPE
ncbi:arrestin homolog [Macrobrachium nipponense]|uniref:arrestin homolog n=1 Tax=Macrobrachium nipponense TaxID=159736 RepID=UPI0030C8695A